MNQEADVETKVFHYNELPDRAKEKARNHYIENWVHDDWYDYVYSMAIEDGKKHGFVIDNIYFSGFYSQGDGACWVGQVDVRQWLETHTQDSIGISAWCHLIQENVISKHLQVSHVSNHYSHENTMRFGEIVDDTDRYEDDYTMQLPSIFKGMQIQNLFDIIESDDTCPYKNIEQIESAIEESAKDYARNIYQQLKEEYEYLCSEEMMLDHFNCNDYHFTNEGVLA